MLTIDRSLDHTGVLWRSLLLAEILCKDSTEVWNAFRLGSITTRERLPATINDCDDCEKRCYLYCLKWEIAERYAPVGLSSLHKSLLSTQLVDIDEMGLEPGYNWSHLFETWSVCRRYFRHTREAVTSLQFRPIDTSIEDPQEPILRRVLACNRVTCSGEVPSARSYAVLTGISNLKEFRE